MLNCGSQALNTGRREEFPNVVNEYGVVGVMMLQISRDLKVLAAMPSTLRPTNYLTRKILARYPPAQGETLPRARRASNLRLDRATFIADCDATLAEVCSKMDTECPPFVCTRRSSSPRHSSA